LQEECPHLHPFIPLTSLPSPFKLFTLSVRTPNLNSLNPLKPPKHALHKPKHPFHIIHQELHAQSAEIDSLTEFGIMGAVEEQGVVIEIDACEGA